MTAEQDWRDKYRDALSKLAAEEGHAVQADSLRKLLHEGRFANAGRAPDKDRTHGGDVQ